MRRSPALTLAALSACALAGCSTPVAPAPAAHVAEVGTPSPSRTLDQALPKVDELATMFGVSGFMGQLVEGGADMLLAGVREAEATPLDCVSTGFQLQKVVYEASPVRTVVSQSWAGGDISGPSATGFFGVVQFATPVAAQAFFAATADKWHRCNGETLVVQQAGHGATGSSRITDVGVDAQVVSAVVLSDAGSAVQRALGVAADCVVDVEVTDVSGAGVSGAQDAVAVAGLMLDKIGAA